MTDAFLDKLSRVSGRSLPSLSFWIATVFDVVANTVPLWLGRLARKQRMVGLGGATGGGTTAATVGSACLCSTHAFAGLFGAAGTAISLTAWEYRPVLLGVSLAMLFVSFLTVHASTGSAVLDHGHGRRLVGRFAVWSGTGLWVLALLAPYLVGLLHSH